MSAFGDVAHRDVGGLTRESNGPTINRVDSAFYAFHYTYKEKFESGKRTKLFLVGHEVMTTFTGTLPSSSPSFA